LVDRREKFTERSLTTYEKSMGMVRLRRPWTGCDVGWDRITLDDGHIIEMSGERCGRSQSTDAGSNDDGALTLGSHHHRAP
jgi:hypothetical protein